MTNEEALEFIKNWNPSLENLSKLFEAVSAGMKALEKYEKYKWHNIREEIPPNNGTKYFVWDNVTKECIIFPGWMFHDNDLFEHGYSAWREIEPFEEVEGG